ncbi:MAG TPA: hypothetical protein VHF01_19040 [Candidatus Acidoferrum sp.]|nr:hypothetical protein [Candidatus Acidoferrum sp.]
MKRQSIGLLAWICLVVLSCVGCAQQKSGSKLQIARAENQASQANAGTDRACTVKLGGVLRDHKGKRLTGVVGVLFAIYEQQEGGAPLWQEVQNVEMRERGYFNAEVGSTIKDGIPAELFTTEKTRWLGKQVLLPDEVEQPRMRLVSTSDGLMAERFETPLIPDTSADQSAVAEAQEKTPDEATSSQLDSQQDRSGPTNRRLRARQRRRGRLP